MELQKTTRSGKPFNARPDKRLFAVLIDLLLAGLVALIPVAGPILSVSYFLTKDALPFLKGQSLGKKVVGIKVVTDKQQPIVNNYAASIIRSITIVIPVFNFFDAITLLFSDRKRWGDKLAHTRVVDT